ncbi:tRNA (guanine(26)-N(2))-dimethyltransferase [Trichinella pseudospiralis]|uniref:tRNA (guanine(26)-N(2))-dimethyltransferase n=1 Tax=Trichinella pseudospiralis TaxID=6337 RepID=A0A0V1FZH7_TRIPS|nr:tRNA (guanine(26)-N(2))-dimethyltransferase [Trichinella pseudospiralis]
MDLEIKEGKAKITFREGSVFYNPVQEFNRDLSVAVLKTFIECQNTDENDSDGQLPSSKKKCKSSDSKESFNSNLIVLDALSASGLRSIRYAKEVPMVKQIIANDLSVNAIQTIKKNIMQNEVDHLVTASQADAVSIMYEHRSRLKRFHVIDLDPYGCASQFLDSAVQAIADGGLLMITCTDVAVLCGKTPESCFSKYGSMSLRAKCCHELALRILLCCLETRANCYGRYVKPLISVSVDFYIRVFVQVFTSAAVAKHSACKKSMVFQCASCESFEIQPLARRVYSEKGFVKFVNAVGPVVPQSCSHCGGIYHIAGPIWSDPIHDVGFVDRTAATVASMAKTDFKLSTTQRLLGILKVIREELPDVPLYYCLSRLASILRLPTPKQRLFRSAILNAGFRVSSSHAYPTAIKTDAPNAFLWDAMKCWAEMKNFQINNSSSSLSAAILKTARINNVDFTHRPDAEPSSKLEGFLRYQMNPQKNWGPKCRAKKG